MAYPILHNFTQGVADKIKTLIEYSEEMTRNKYLEDDLVSGRRG